MYNRIKIIVTNDSNRDLLAMFNESFERCKSQRYFANPAVISG